MKRLHSENIYRCPEKFLARQSEEDVYEYFDEAITQSKNFSGHLYLPQPARIRHIVQENSLINTYELEFTDGDYNRRFTYQPGQFMMVSIPHCGEAPISFSSTPTRPGSISLSVRKAGVLTSAMHELKAGAVIGLRGPYGRPFPMEALKGRDLLFVAGGIGLAPLRGAISYCLDKQGDYGSITILYGCRTPSDIAFQSDIKKWQGHVLSNCSLTVDQSEPGWDGAVGQVTGLFDCMTPGCDRTTALVCGPPLMFRSVIARLNAMGFADHDIITTLERHMKCGVGICRHCHMDGKLVCHDGPVFSLAELKKLNVPELGD